MKRIILSIIFLAVICMGANKVGPVSQYGKLITGTNSSGEGRIYGSCEGVGDGKEVQVRGMSLYWSLLSKSTDFYNETAIKNMIDNMKIQIIRIPMATGDEYWGEYYGYNKDPNTQMKFVKSVVEAAINQDIYVIIDWHSHEAHNQTSNARRFFSEMAMTYGNYDNVIFEIYNEPLQVEWNTIKNYAEKIIAEIRKYSSNLIIVGTPNWDQRIDTVANVNNRIKDDNVAYTFHYYAGSHKVESEGAWLKKAIKAGVPVFVSEWGTVNADGAGGVSSTNDKWQNVINTYKLSWANWSASKISEGSAAFENNSSPNYLQFTSSGNKVKEYLNSNPTTYKRCKEVSENNYSSSSSLEISYSSSSKSSSSQKSSSSEYNPSLDVEIAFSSSSSKDFEDDVDKITHNTIYKEKELLYIFNATGTRLKTLGKGVFIKYYSDGTSKLVFRI